MEITSYEINVYAPLTEWQREYFVDCVTLFFNEDFGLKNDEFEIIETQAAEE